MCTYHGVPKLDVNDVDWRSLARSELDVHSLGSLAWVLPLFLPTYESCLGSAADSNSKVFVVVDGHNRMGAFSVAQFGNRNCNLFEDVFPGCGFNARTCIQVRYVPRHRWALVYGWKEPNRNARSRSGMELFDLYRGLCFWRCAGLRFKLAE